MLTPEKIHFNTKEKFFLCFSVHLILPTHLAQPSKKPRHACPKKQFFKTVIVSYNY